MSEPVTSHFAAHKFAQHIEQGGHALLADTTATFGGQNAGMNPHALVAAALSTCTGMTLWMYAAKKGWPLTDAPVQVQLDQQKERTLVRRTVQLVGPLDHEQRARLLEVADRCPIHRLLCGEVQIATELAPETP